VGIETNGEKISLESGKRKREEGDRETTDHTECRVEGGGKS